jgi:hypothetical protein
MYIRFLTEQDRIRGFAGLVKQACVGSLPGQVYQVPIEALPFLENQQIGYRRATDEEVQAANDQIRNPAPAVL